MPTSKEELERVHLRFIRVNDDAKLSEILSKILPNLLNVFLESDLVNTNLSNEKIKTLEQVFGHVMMRVKNSKEVNPPWAAILDIFNQEIYQQFTNQTVKRHVANRIFEFIFESFNRIPAESDQQFFHVLFQTLESDDLSYVDKCRLFLVLLQRMSIYMKSSSLDKLGQIIQPILTEDLKLSFLQMSLYYLIHNISPLSIQQSLQENFTASVEEMSLKFRSELRETATQFIQTYEETILKFLGVQTIFKAEEILPIFMLASLSNINKTREYAEISVRSLFSIIDTKDKNISENVYRIIFTEFYIYKDFSERQDQEVQMIPGNMQAKLIEYLIKFECSASQYPLNQKLVFHCFFSAYVDYLETVGLKFIKHMIRFNDLPNEQNTVQFLKSTLLKIMTEGQFGLESQSMALLLLGDMAMRNYHALDDNIDVAIDTFQRLKARVQELEDSGHYAIRTDTASNNYIESLNRFRDCFQEKMTDPSKRNLLLGFIINTLNKEGNTTHSEILYLLFLYLTHLDQGQFKSTILLHSIILKDHLDIKIKKEAQTQIDKFNQQHKADQQILRPFLKDIRLFLQRNSMDYVYAASEYHLQEVLTFSNSPFKADFIDKMFEITSFSIKFLKDEFQKDPSEAMDLGDIDELKDTIERLLLMNLNQNFQLVKTDFTASLNLIYEYLKLTYPIGALLTIGLNFIYKLSVDSVNLNQRVLSLKLIVKLLRNADRSENHIQEFFSKLHNALPSQDKLQHLTYEQKLNSLYLLTVWNLYATDDNLQQMLHQIIESLTVNSSLSPNVMEQLKFLAACLKKLGERIDLNQQIIGHEMLINTIQYFTDYIKRNEIDPVFRKNIISNIAGMLKNVDKELKLEKAKELYEAMIGYDNGDIQEQLGKAFAKINKYASEADLVVFALQQISKVQDKSEQASLVIKRNATVYLYQVVDLYGKSQQGIQDMFIEIQRVFLKFLFDRKPSMQDLSSRALSKIYNLGSPQVRTQLVDALSKTLSGEKSATEHQEKDENQELLLEFKDNTSTEQREKLKTYKDLCNIAVELGHRELIYQFLEVHRHLAHYQDIKNAAKGLSSIIMLDERLRGDLLKIAPKILLLSYDHNDEVKETMKELWTNLIEIEKEEIIINDRWDEIFKEAIAGLNSNEYRRRQSSALALTDLLNNRTWKQIKLQFKEVFLTTLGLLDDSKDSVKMAAFQLSKTMKRVTIKFGNVYTNSNLSELEEILAIVIPMILNDCMKSTMQAVRFFSIDLLFDIIKTSQNQNMMKQLKIQNKHERQLVFNYNSEQKMKEIMNKFLDRIVVEVLANLSQMNKAVDTINYFEQLAASYGLNTNSKVKSKLGISEGEINDLRLKYTKESAWGEILKICRDLMTEETFSKILNELLGFMLHGHDQITKSSAISFVEDIILENKLFLITPQNSRKIAQKLIDIYSQNSVNNALSIKESIQNLYAQCIGLQMKILRDYPKTIGQIIESIVNLPKELDIIICLNIYEISKNLPVDVLKAQDSLLKQAFPIIYINRFQANDHRLKTLCRKAYQHLTDHITQLVEQCQEPIFKIIKNWLDSPSYDDRVAASNAMQEICAKLGEEDVRGSQIATEVIDKMHQLVQGKYFNNKETVIEGFMALIKLANLFNNANFVNNYIGDTCLKQIEKNLNSNLTLKNQMLKSVQQCLENSKVINDQVKLACFNLFFADLTICLKSVSEKASRIESMDEFEEKREEEKQTLQSALLYLECIPFILLEEGQSAQLADVCLTFYNITNWIVRNGILKSYIKILQQKNTGQVAEATVKFVNQTLISIVDVGEKYDANLALISELLLLFSERYYTQMPLEMKPKFQMNAMFILGMLQEKGSEELKKNLDVIKRYIEV